MRASRSASSFAHVLDVARGHVLAMEHGTVGESYMICGPPYTLLEVFRLAAKLVGRRHGPVPLPWWMLRAVAYLFSGIGTVVPPVRGPAMKVRAGAGATYLGDDSKARRELGYTNRSIQKSLEDLLANNMSGSFQKPE